MKAAVEVNIGRSAYCVYTPNPSAAFRVYDAIRISIKFRFTNLANKGTPQALPYKFSNKGVAVS
jgi:hypothetical protein